MNKVVYAIIFTLSAAYVLLSVLGLAGVSSETGGVAYRLIIIVTLLFLCSRILAGVLKRGGADPLAGAVSIGMGILAVNELYSFSYIYLMHGDAADITVSNYSRPCAYLFFMRAVLLLLPPSMKWGKALRTSTGALSTMAILIIFYNVIAARAVFLYYSALSITILCILPAGCLLYQSVMNGGFKEQRVFACLMIAISVLDTANRLLILFAPGWRWRDIVLSLYPAVYLGIGYGVLRLRKAKGEGGTECG